MNTTSDASENDAFNLREFLEQYLFHWKWFALSIIIALVCAFLYLRYTTAQYEVVSTILIQDKENESIYSELNAFEDLELVSDSKSQFDTEIGILKSRGLMERVIAKLNLNKIYLAKGKVKNSELYGRDLPFKVNFFGNDSLIFAKDTLFSIVPTSTTKFDLLNANGETTGDHLFGENIISDIGDFTVLPTTLVPIELNLKVDIIIKPVELVAEAYRSKIVIEPVNRKSSLINMSLTGPIKEKSSDILTVLLQQYIGESIQDKNLVAESTDQFITERIDAISEELALVDNDAQSFLTKNNLTNAAVQTDLILSSNTSLEKEILDLETQLKLTHYVANHIEQKSDRLLPTGLGISSIGLSEGITRYNEIIQERNRLLLNSSDRNPAVLNLNNQVDEFKMSIIQSLDNLKSTLSISLRDLKSQKIQLNSKITSVPKNERQLKDIERQQKTIETLYLYLLQKREENAIALAVKTPNAKLIDKPYAKPKRAHPKRLLVLLMALAAGFAIPFVLLYLLFLTDNKVHTIDNLESKLNVPVLGGIPKYNGKHNLLISETASNAATEAFRTIRTNLNFHLPKSSDGAKTIFVTSTITNEGKTLTAINLSKILFMTSKKVLLIETDIRNPKLDDYLNINKNKGGLSGYLMNDNIKAEDLIEVASSDGFDVVQGGSGSSNPSELFMNGRIDDLLDYAKSNYDFIIIDTAPISTVTDTMVLCQGRADLCIVVVRANYLDQRMLKKINKLHHNGKLQNTVAILNNISSKGLHGNSYKNGSESKIQL